MKHGKLDLQGDIQSAESKLNLDFATQALMRNLIQESFDRKAHDLSGDENMGNIFIDVFSDATGIDSGLSSLYSHRGSPNYDVIKASPIELDYMEYASDGAAQTAYVTDAPATLAWTERQPAGDVDKKWAALASNSDGSRLIAGVTEGGRLYTSSDYGVNWTERQPAGDVGKNWSIFASDSDGSHLIAGIYNGQVLLLIVMVVI